MKRFLLLGLSCLFLFACGKNDAVYSVNPSPTPPVTAPPPTGPVPPGVPQTPYPYPNNGGGFNPQMPSGYPPQYYPFLPVDNYFRQNSQMQMYWTQMWQRWQQYSYQVGYNQYDFGAFWYDFCPQEWYGSSFEPMYNYFDYNVYSWMTPQTQLSSYADPYTFWQNYVGFPMDSYGYCATGGCYYY